MSPTLMGVAEVGQYLGVAKQNIVNWRMRYPDFPRPHVVLAIGPVWLDAESQIRDWYAKHLLDKGKRWR